MVRLAGLLPSADQVRALCKEIVVSDTHSEFVCPHCDKHVRCKMRGTMAGPYAMKKHLYEKHSVGPNTPPPQKKKPVKRAAPAKRAKAALATPTSKKHAAKAPSKK